MVEKRDRGEEEIIDSLTEALLRSEKFYINGFRKRFTESDLAIISLLLRD
ncbi:hypothetical protein TNCV_1489681, partial [Trichonephila clavipes]